MLRDSIVAEEYSTYERWSHTAEVLPVAAYPNGSSPQRSQLIQVLILSLMLPRNKDQFRQAKQYDAQPIFLVAVE